MRRRMVATLTFLTLSAILLTGCAMEVGSPAPDPPMEVGSPAPAPPPTEYVAARSWLPRGENEVPGYRSYGYLVLTQRLAAEDVDRYLIACEEFTRRLNPTEDNRDVDPRALMVTHWLLTNPVADREVCAELVVDYDYARGARIASAVGKGGATGPVLAAWTTPFPTRAAGNEALVWDLSQYDDAELGRAIRLWIELFARDPSLWQDRKYNLIWVRERLRNAALQYDEVTLAVITSFLGDREG